ncbi:MAG: hypothetical protein BIFFINMI_02184 [Phycisphaerae bacterium]|nr:hypothetical protein [Phycisphaerae bacterium]
MNAARLCVVGCGDWARRMHWPAMARLSATGLARWVGACDLDAAAAGACAEALAADATFTDSDAMLDRCRPDGVVLLLPPPATAGMIARVAARGLPFLTEKPPAPDAATHRDLIARVGGLAHLVGYNRRHAPYLTRAREWLAGRAIQAVTVLFTRHRRREPDFSTTAVHAIDTGLFLTGDRPRQLDLACRTAGVVRNLFVSGWSAGGARIEIAVLPDTASAMEHYCVASSDRSVRIAYPQSNMHDLPGFVELHEGNRVVERLGPGDFGLNDDDLPGLGGIATEHELFARALAGGAAVESTLAATLATQQVRDAFGRLGGLEGGGRSQLYFGPSGEVRESSIDGAFRE